VDNALQVRGITKAFPRVVANDNVSLDVIRGQVHALVGENGAGKSTLMNILYGLVRPDAGEILVDGLALPAAEGFLGIAHGIGMIHQHFMLIGQFTVLENIVLGAEPRRGLMLDKAGARARVERLMQEYGIAVDCDRRIDDLSVGEEQRVEILKVLYRDARIIIMDEPTSVLTPQESCNLFATMRTLTRAGRTVIFITHKLEEVMEVADTVTVMRAGRVIGTSPTGQTDIPRLAEMMIGHRMEAMQARRSAPSGETVLDVRGVSLVTRKGSRVLDRVTFAVRRGEIFGLCGVDGNGQDELFEVLIGLRAPTCGTITLGGIDVTSASVSRRLRAGLAHIPPDRIRMGLVASMTLRENLILGRHNDREFAGAVFLKQDSIAGETARLVRQFGIEPPDVEMKAGLFSGGNQQKAIAAREISRHPEFLIVSQPTRGLDVGAARLIHELLVRHAEEGKGVLLVSADLAEVMELADRIGVMYRGTVVGVLDRAEATEDKLGLMMAGAAATIAAGGSKP
jgi:ABC-type uncharacterized transport system ATPase subunit